MDVGIFGGKFTVLLAILLLLFSVAISNPVSSKRATDRKAKSTVSAGHICIETRTEASFENVTTWYRCQQNYTGTCGWFWNTWNCTKERQNNCSKTELKLVPKNVTRYVCCTGWRRDDQSRCLIPICKGGCQNGGTCVDKDGSPTCECLEGYSGRRCDDNLDECLLPNSPCDHVCVNRDTSYTCKCFDGYVLQPDNKSCSKSNGITTGPVPGNLTSPGNKRIVDAKTVYILVSIGAILLILLIVSTTYLFLKRKKRLAMETILKDRVTFSVNDYSNPSFRRFSNEFILTNDNQPRQRSMYSIRVPGDGQVNNSDTPRNDVNIQNHQFNGSLPELPTNPPNHPGDQSLRISNASNESLNSNVSTGWTNPLFLNAREPDNNRPATYAMIEEDCYSGSNLSGIYASIPECVQTLEGFDVGESNDYDSFSSDEFEQEAVYENGFVTPVKQPIEIKSVYLHTPCQSTQYLSIPFPIQEENNYEYVSDNCDKVDQNNELEYDYVANDDDEMFSNRNSSGSSQLETKAAADDDVYEDTDSPNTTLDTTVDDEHDADNSSQTYNYAFDENPHKYDYGENPEANEYYEDGTSIDLQLNDPQDEYDYVSSANVRQSLENINNSDTISQRQSSVDEEYTGPTTYYDDAILLAMSGDLDNYPDCLGELPEYEYVRNSNITEVSDSTNRISDSSDSTFAGGDKANRSSAVSYASIDGSDTEVSADEHDYDEISKHTADSVNNESEGEYDSDYEKVSDVFGRNSKVMNDFAEEQQKYENPKLKFQNFGAGKGSSIIIVDNEPVYDEVCAPGTSSGNDQDR